jgi:iron complex transport system substrate-binding protein
MEEEINIMIHKLKFLPSENFPTVSILQQESDFAPIYSDELHNKIKIAGANLILEDKQDAQVLIIIKNDDSLYSTLPTLLEQEWLQATPAYRDNRLFIIESTDFGQNGNFLKDTEVLAEILQPKYFYYGHEGNEWIKFDLVHS